MELSRRVSLPHRRWASRDPSDLEPRVTQASTANGRCNSGTADSLVHLEADHDNDVTGKKYVFLQRTPEPHQLGRQRDHANAGSAFHRVRGNPVRTRLSPSVLGLGLRRANVPAGLRPLTHVREVYGSARME